MTHICFSAYKVSLVSTLVDIFNDSSGYLAYKVSLVSTLVDGVAYNSLQHAYKASLVSTLVDKYQLTKGLAEPIRPL